MSNHNYILEVSYPLTDYLLNKDVDEKIRNTINKDEDGSGAGFGERDMSFYYRRSKQAYEAFVKLRKIKSPKLSLNLSYNAEY